MGKIQKNLFTLKDSWPWAVILTAIIGINIKAISYNWANPIAIIPLGILLVISLFISIGILAYLPVY